MKIPCRICRREATTFIQMVNRPPHKEVDETQSAFCDNCFWITETFGNWEPSGRDEWLTAHVLED